MATDREKQSVLIIDDDEALVTLLDRVMANFPFRVELTSSPVEGRKLIEAGNVGVLVCDIRLPHISGRDLMRLAKERIPDVFIVAISGFSAQEEVLRMIEEGVVWKFISKPFDINNFLALVTEAVHLHEQRANRAGVEPVKEERPPAIKSCRTSSSRVFYLRDGEPPGQSLSNQPDDAELSVERQSLSTIGLAEGGSLATDISGFSSSRYTIVARGGAEAGATFRARDTYLDTDVTLRFFAPANTDELKRLKFRSLQFMRFAHQNMTRVYQLTFESGVHYLVMENVRGPTVQEVMDGASAMSVATASRIARGASAALDHALRHNIFSFDLTPSSIILSDDGGVKLDALAITAVVDAETVAADPVLRDRLRFMSPERRRGEEVDNRSDVFSLGVILYEALSGRPPYPVDAAPGDLANHRPGPLTGDGAELSPALLRAVHPDREERWTTASQLAAAIREAAGGIMHDLETSSE